MPPYIFGVLLPEMAVNNPRFDLVEAHDFRGESDQEIYLEDLGRSYEPHRSVKLTRRKHFAKFFLEVCPCPKSSLSKHGFHVAEEFDE